MSLEEVAVLWGEPTEFHLSRPPGCSYGPVWIFYRLIENGIGGHTGQVTHAAIMPRELHEPGPPGFLFDLPVASESEVVSALTTLGLHVARAEDLMYPGEPEIVLRVAESGVELLFDAMGRLTEVGTPLPRSV
jgi:hypothetical protein